jgi:hypothetical protein
LLVFFALPILSTSYSLYYMHAVIKLKKTNKQVNYQLLMEPELKIRLAELKIFHDIDVPESLRELIRAWVRKIEAEISVG